MKTIKLHAGTDFGNPWVTSPSRRSRWECLLERHARSAIVQLFPGGVALRFYEWSRQQHHARPPAEQIEVLIAWMVWADEAFRANVLRNMKSHMADGTCGETMIDRTESGWRVVRRKSRHEIPGLDRWRSEQERWIDGLVKDAVRWVYPIVASRVPAWLSSWPEAGRGTAPTDAFTTALAFFAMVNEQSRMELVDNMIMYLPERVPSWTGDSVRQQANELVLFVGNNDDDGPDGPPNHRAWA